MNLKKYICFTITAFSLLTGCREAYLPPALSSPNNYLVVDGFINSGNDTTVITINRTRNLDDSLFVTYEDQANVRITSASGANFPLQGVGGGTYFTPAIPLNPSTLYRLEITTRDGKQYASDYVPVKKTPVIDSLSWFQDDAVHCTVSTHDNTNNTRYYRWEYEETWEYHSPFYTVLGYDYNTNSIFERDSTNMIYTCWHVNPSTQIVIGSTTQLNADIVSNFPVVTHYNGSEKLGVRYSILVRQYALTKEAFLYWQLLRKNATELGSIFGTQPSKIGGNIHCLSNPEEPVIGFISASSVEKKRLFINKDQIKNWHVDLPPELAFCEAQIVGLADGLRILQQQPGLVPYYLVPVLPPFTTPPTMALTKHACVDCTLTGGSTEKPSYW